MARQSKVDVEYLRKLHFEGKGNREIARIIGVHHSTVNNHLKKLGLVCNTANQPIDMVSDTEARCKKCSKIKPLKEFQFGRKGQKYEYRFSYCNDCRKKQNYLSLNSDINKFLSNTFNRLKIRAKNNNIPFSITKKDYIAQYNIQNGQCFFSDEKLLCQVGNSLSRNSLSIDKLIPHIGYVPGNIVFATHRINTCKCDLSMEEMAKWMPEWYYRIKLVEVINVVESFGIKVHYSNDDGYITDEAKNCNGGFEARENIKIYLPTFIYKHTFNTNIKQKSELLMYTLAHEFGHFRSFQDGYWTDELQQLRIVNHDENMKEEKRAWMHALNFLKKNNVIFNIIDFNTYRDRCLKNYEMHYKISQLNSTV